MPSTPTTELTAQTAANKLLPMLDAAVYKHVVLGLIFLKYVSDAFKERRAELEAAFRDPHHDYYLSEDADELIPVVGSVAEAMALE